jgi:hypothetical protein
VLFGGLGAMLIAFSLGLRERQGSETQNLQA